MDKVWLAQKITEMRNAIYDAQEAETELRRQYHKLDGAVWDMSTCLDDLCERLERDDKRSHQRAEGESNGTE